MVMTTSRTPLFDPVRLAGAARSVLSCPAAVELVVEGVPHLLDGDDELAMQDLGGIPTFSSRPDSPLARAGAEHRSALLTLHSGLGRAGSPARRATLTLAGRLETSGREDCACCGEVRDVLTLDLNFVLLARGRDGSGPEQQLRVPLEEFRSPEHHLNPGFLQRSTEHANHCHQEELRRAVSTTTGTRDADVLGVALTGLTPDGVEVQWVDPEGSHSSRLVFPAAARTTAELGEMLRQELHAGLC
jgi:hypothetical protein